MSTAKGIHQPAQRVERAQRTGVKGVALILTLLLLILLSAITLAMVLAVSSDMLINGYYQNFRGAFYAADSGLNIARQDMVSQVLAAVPATFSILIPPIPVGIDATVQTNILSKYGSRTSINQGQAAKSWPESYQITAASLALVSSPTQPVVSTDTNGKVTGYQYTYNYSLTSVGQSLSNEQTTVSDRGSLIVNVNVGSATGVTTSFAAWGMFIDQNTLCDGTYLAPGTVTGPVFTNGGWNLGTAGAYIFTDPVGTASSTVGYQFSSNCFTSSNTSYKYKSQTIAPTYQAGLNLSQSSVALPPNDYSQQRAVLDGVGTNPNPVTPNDLHNGLRDIDGSQYPNGGTSSGVFLPYTVDSKSGALSFAGGGIYVEGSAQVTVSTSGASAEVWTIKQSSTTTTITVDSSANTTTISSGGTTKTIAGVPTQYDPASGAAQRAATMLYVNGSITSLSGPGQGVPAIQDGQAISIIAANNITVTGDILYKTEPVTKTQNQIPGTPADTLIPGSNNGQVLGIFTSTGDIQMQNSQSNGTLEIDASLATISQGGSGGLVNTGNAINTLSIVGGLMQNKIKNLNATTRNVFFDRRFAQGGFAPPWFPSTTLTPSATVFSGASSSVQRTQWVNQTSY